MTDKDPSAESGESQVDAPDIDTLLEQFAEEGEPEKKVEEEKPAVSPEIGQRLDRIDAYVQRQEAKDTESEIDTLVNGAVESHEGLKVLPEGAFRGYVEEQARRDPRIQQAWSQRNTNPQGIQKIVDALGKKYAEALAQKPDERLTNDREAARAYVESQAEEPTTDDATPPQAELAAMTPAELDASIMADMKRD